MYTIYRITNTLNGKFYIGFTGRTLDQRWRSHLSAARQGSPYRFHSALRKYGPDPWKREVLFETPDEDDARRYEEEAINDAGAMERRVGYNAKPGGCGGWVVPPAKYAAWKEKLSAANKGTGNGNANPLTNDEIVQLMVDFANECGFLPGVKRFVEYGAQRGFKVPKSYSNTHRGGFSDLQRKAEQATGLIFNRYHRDDEHRKKLANAITGRRWYHKDELRTSRQLSENDAAQGGWILGRKKYD